NLNLLEVSISSCSASEVKSTAKSVYCHHKSLVHEVYDSAIITESTCDRKGSIEEVNILPKTLPAVVASSEYKQDLHNFHVKALVVNSGTIQGKQVSHVAESKSYHTNALITDVSCICPDSLVGTNAFSHATPEVMKIDNGYINYVNGHCQLSLGGILIGICNRNPNIMAYMWILMFIMFGIVRLHQCVCLNLCECLKDVSWPLW
ncbi:hypothetical protein KSF78_0000872, partial [Schistosoma japonicum]